VNELSEEGELFYRRLMSIVDDYGRFEADPDLIRARAFPRQFDRWTVERIQRCLTEVSGESPLVTVYHGGSRKLLQINNFGQRVQSKEKYPGPDSPFSTVDHGEPPSSRSRISKSETKADAESLVASPKIGSARTTGSRLDRTEISEDMLNFAISEMSWSRPRAMETFHKFRDYWIAKAGAGARKTDWLATWRNWCRREDETTPLFKGKIATQAANGNYEPPKVSDEESVRLMREADQMFRDFEEGRL
jgi:hypothetical protein